MAGCQQGSSHSKDCEGALLWRPFSLCSQYDGQAGKIFWKMNKEELGGGRGAEGDDGDTK